ncbi:hypothetical protein OIU79_002758 [Salix purpurea]|uniref:Uncharacterized protein n=1 Tax=Salix purpurea TaxID=77065 RepID=A0A9Q0UKI1_SALPP|nr:hypothetical protein OIU79_002758 [Salix purpurea]
MRPTGPGMRMQSKSGMGKNLSSDIHADKNIVSEHIPSTLFQLGGTSKRHASKPVLPTESVNPAHGNNNKIGPSSSWISSLQRIHYANMVDAIPFIMYLAMDLVKRILVIYLLEAAKSFGDLESLFHLCPVKKFQCIFMGSNVIKLPERFEVLMERKEISGALALAVPFWMAIEDHKTGGSTFLQVGCCFSMFVPSSCIFNATDKL